MADNLNFFSDDEESEWLANIDSSILDKPSEETQLHDSEISSFIIVLVGKKVFTASSVKKIGNLRTTTTTLSTTTGSEIQCTAQVRLANFVVVVSSTTPNTVQSRRPASQA